MTRPGNRSNDEKRATRIIPDFIKTPDGSVLIEIGDTRVLCSAMLEEKVPPFMKGSGRGWITAEYSLLPSSTGKRTPREASRGRISGRTSEIQRLIGRSLRAAVDMEKLGEKTIWIDCDVIQADGGTRTAAITGSFVALKLALKKYLEAGIINEIPLKDHVAAISVGILESEKILDLEYVEDSVAEVDMNIVMTGSGEFVEIQGTAEGQTFSGQALNEMLALARKGINELIALQKETLGE